MAENLHQHPSDAASAVVVLPRLNDGRGGAPSLNSILESAAQGVCALDHHGLFTYVNPTAARMLRWNPEELLGKSMHDLVHHGRADASVHAPDVCPICLAIESGDERRVEHEIFWRSDGSSFPVSFAVAPIRGAGAGSGVVITFTDAALPSVSAEELRHIQTTAQCLLWYADVQFVSAEKPLRWFLWPWDEEAGLRFLPIERRPGETFAESFYRARLDEDRGPSNDCSRNVLLAGGTGYRQEFRCRTADGQIRWIAEDVKVERVAAGRWRAVGVCTDITGMKEREREIEILNERLQRAMTETHHRVKNNLQIIAAMIDLQTIDRPPSLPLAEFARLGQHVRTLAAVHEMLTQEAKSGDTGGDSISARAMLGRLLPMIQQTAGSDMRFCLDDARLSSRQGTSLAIITNELVSNALKHGAGEVEVRFKAEADLAVLEVADNGPGLPPDFNPEASASTGLDLVMNLTRWDLQGSAEFTNGQNGGAVARVRFRAAPAAGPITPSSAAAETPPGRTA